MSHPKNSITGNLVQVELLTSRSDFYFKNIEASGIRTQPLLSVQAGQDCEEALNTASMLLGSVDEIMTAFTDEGLETNSIFGLRFLVEASKALIDSSMVAVMTAKREGGAQ